MGIVCRGSVFLGKEEDGNRESERVRVGYKGKRWRGEGLLIMNGVNTVGSLLLDCKHSASVSYFRLFLKCFGGQSQNVNGK